MKVSTRSLHSERGSAGIKFLFILLAIALLGNAGYNYVPVAYNGAAFKQEMDTAVVKALGASGQMKPGEIAKAHIQRAAFDYKVPADAVIDIRVGEGPIRAYAAYQQPVNMLPFGLFKYNYKFEHTATPRGYLLEE